MTKRGKRVLSPKSDRVSGENGDFPDFPPRCTWPSIYPPRWISSIFLIRPTPPLPPLVFIKSRPCLPSNCNGLRTSTTEGAILVRGRFSTT
ncbi:hypothetical protein CEXT_436911 [Caerostris extrusa]|uniref:Uncharacterized protein n=1 Tax=Caerostris extrusa TaxID=172846 RepID=A0AAV4XHQ4_CAEEX|nr:hypothetical protein CEXT_436911 [Caerostris extrusa]